MTLEFRPARRSSAKLLIGVYSESGRGKTWSSLLLARGFVGPKGRIMMVETESGRGEAYVDVLPGGYSVIPLHDSYSPVVYGEAIALAEKQGSDALIIDSASHEWEGLGGVLDMAAKNQADGKKGPIVWQQPKILHQKEFVLRLMRTSIPIVIVCMRAKYPMYEVKQAHLDKWLSEGKHGKPPRVGDWARSEQLDPKQSEDILYEMFVHGWLDEGHRYHVTKYPRAIPAFRDLIIDGERLSVDTGRRLAEWASGGAPRKQAAEAPDDVPPVDNAVDKPTPAEAPVRLFTITEIRNQYAACQSAPDVNTVTDGIRNKIAEADKEAATNIRADRIEALRKAISK